MNRTIIETVMGALVVIIAGFFLVFAYSSANLRPVSGYPLQARFSSVDGIVVGSDVRIAGVKVGSVTSLALDDQHRALLGFTVAPGISLSSDTVASVASEGLLGGRFIALEPGAEEEKIAAGGEIAFTQSMPSLEQLIGKFIFSTQDKGENKGEDKGAVGSQ
jgi:phospholipid/cholesterol/gamma-HCH transport system substrate-binding protein